MLTSSVINDTNIVTATYAGELRSEDMTSVHDKINEVVREQGNANLLIEYGDVDWGKVEPAAAWEDLTSIRMLENVNKFAVVTDTTWVQKLSQGADVLGNVDIRAFNADQRDDAVAWLSQ